MDIQQYIQSGVIESYVLGVASEEEAAELLNLTRLHPAIKQALEDTEIAFEKNAMANATAPDAALKAQLLSALHNDFAPETGKVATLHPSTGIAPELPLPLPGQHRIKQWKYVAAASVILLTASISYNFYSYQRNRQTDEKYQALLTEKSTIEASINTYKAKLDEANASIQIVGNPVMATIKMPGIAGKEHNLATIYWNTQTKDVYVMANQLPQAPAGKQYQLWAIVNGKPVDAGLLGNCSGSICKMKNITSAQAFAITLEKAGGSAVPTLTEMYVMGAAS